MGRFRLAHMIQGFFCHASLKLWHAVQSWLLKVWLSTFSYSLVFHRMNNISLVEQKLALWFWPLRSPHNYTSCLVRSTQVPAPCTLPRGHEGHERASPCAGATLVMWDQGIPIPVVSHGGSYKRSVGCVWAQACTYTLKLQITVNLEQGLRELVRILCSWCLDIRLDGGCKLEGSCLP